MLVLLSLLALCVTPARSAAAYTRGLCLYSCENCLKGVPFRDADNDVSAEAQSCRGRLATSSLYLCMDMHCSDAARDEGLEMFSTTCRDRFNSVAPPFSIVSNYSRDDIAQMPRLSFDDGPSKEPYQEPAIPSPEFFGRWFGTLVCDWFIEALYVTTTD